MNRKEAWIALARHGRPACDDTRWLAPNELSQWIANFNRSSIVVDEIPAALRTIASEAGIVVSSTYERSLQSIYPLAPMSRHVADRLFVEADLPYSLWRSPRLPVRLWLAIFRIAWLMGFSAHAESLASTTLRAQAATERLIGLAEENGSVLLVGHGIFNRLIARQLKAHGWSGATNPSSSWWGVTIYSKRQLAIFT